MRKLPEHGTLSRYRYYRCRCSECRYANTVQKRIERGGGAMKVAAHGTRSKYVRGCRCPPCKEANRNYQRDAMRLRRAEGKARDLPAIKRAP